MKKMFIVMFVIAMAAACGGKKAQPAQPMGGSGDGSATMPTDGSAAAPETPPPAM